MVILHKFWAHASTTPSPWLAVAVCIATNVSILLYTLMECRWFAVVPLIITGVPIFWIEFDLYRKSQNGMMAGLHPNGASILEEWHRKKFVLGDDVEVHVSYGLARRYASTRTLTSGGCKQYVTFCTKYMLMGSVNSDVTVCDVENTGMVEIEDVAAGFSASNGVDIVDWVPTSAQGTIVDITEAVKESNNYSGLYTVVHPHRSAYPAHTTITFSRSCKNE